MKAGRVTIGACSTALTMMAIVSLGEARADRPDVAHYRAVLQEHVDSHGQVSYRALKASPDKLSRYLQWVANLDPGVVGSWGAKARIAFWINTYNAWTLKAIIDHYPIKSIRKIPSVWDKKSFTALGRLMSLNEVEHEVLRKRFDEPRIHFALVCASVGCPILWNEPYTGARLDAQLDDQVRRFVRLARNLRLDHEAGKVGLSSIFDWYGKDFVPRARRDTASREEINRAVLDYLAPFVSPRDRELMSRKGVPVGFVAYDWSLNERS